MVSVGDRIRLSLNKGADREGVVTGVTGSLLRVRWSSEEETSVVPAPGTLTVLAPATRKAVRPSRKTTAAPKTRATKKASATKKVASKDARDKKAAATTKTGTSKKAAASKKAPSKKAAMGKKSRGASRPPR
jgi:hypothetical protein